MTPEHGGTAKPALTVTFWGTRGSIATPGPDTCRFGGNTPCVEVVADDGRRYILDAGTGIRPLGEALVAERKQVDVDLFLTHFHWDHIQGLPFFEPTREASARIRIHAPPQGSASPSALLTLQMEEAFFPLQFGELPGIEDVRSTSQVPLTLGGVAIDSMKVCHPSETVGYRVRSRGRTLVYIPDNELSPLRAESGQPRYWELVEFCAGADLLIHDAMYTAVEYPARSGWGHSTFEEAVALAEDAGVRTLRLFHHAPERTDPELESVVLRLREELVEKGSTLEIAAASEGEQVMLTPLVYDG